ncbi:MAG: putative vesicular transport factor Uso1p [Candidatus Ruthia sp. Asou_11_S2]|nr:putative vesicular transport factor Uso1p [Candidatus Ruthia sp. Asou_11_S2]
MENKSLFSSIVLTVALVVGYFIHNNQVIKLNNEISSLAQEYNTKLIVPQPNNAKQVAKSSTAPSSTNALENLNNQLIKTRSALKKAQDKFSLATSKGHVLNDEILQKNDARTKVKTLKNSLTSAQEKLKISDERLKYLKSIFEEQNKNTVTKNIARIKKLKETSAGIAITGLIVPAIGVATLISYTTEEIQNYCDNIKNTMDLEYKVFGKVILLDNDIQTSYHQ